MQEAAVASNLLGTMAIFQFIAVIAMIPLCIRFGPAPSYRMVVVLFGLSSLSYALLYYAGLSDVYSLLLLISAVAGLGRGGINYVPWNTYTYIADVDEAITGQRREDFCRHHDPDPQSLAGGGGDAGGDHYAVVGVCFRAKIQPEGVSHTILLILSVGTLVVLACGFLVSLRFKLNLRTHSVLRSETLRMRELGYAQSEQTSAEHRAVVELLAGMPYDCLWGNNNIGYLNRNKPAAPALIKGGALNSTYTRG